MTARHRIENDLPLDLLAKIYMTRTREFEENERNQRHRMENQPPLGLLPNMEIEVVTKYTPNKLTILPESEGLDPEDTTTIWDLDEYDDLFFPEEFPS